MARAEEEEAPPQLLHLFNCFWYERTVLTNSKSSNDQFPPEPAKVEVVFDDDHEKLFQKSEMMRVPSTLHVRSLSGQALGVDLQEVPSPDSVLAGAKLETILSGKEVSSEFEFEEESEKNRGDQTSKSLPTKNRSGRGDKQKRRRMKRHGSSKSLSELEFQEVKGFMDLGFVFSEQDKNSADLVSIIPGLQRLGKSGEEAKVSDKSSVPRPYLSEAWEIFDRRRAAEVPLVKWRVPDLTNEMAVKDQLKFWAHAVASTVR